MADKPDPTTLLRLVLWCDRFGDSWGVGRTAEEAQDSAVRLVSQVPVDGGFATDAELRALRETGFPVTIETAPSHMERVLDRFSMGDQVLVEVGVALGYPATMAVGGAR